MIVQVDVSTLFSVLGIWSVLASVFAVYLYPYGGKTRMLATTLVLSLLGPFVPLIAILVLPKIYHDWWIDYARARNNAG